MEQKSSSHTTLIDVREVQRRTLMTRTRMYSEIAEGRFPRPVKVGERKMGWVESEIELWIRERVAERDGVDQVA